MWFLPGVKSVPSDLLREVWLCAHLIVLHRRCDGRGVVDEAAVRRESCSMVQGCLQQLSRDEWGEETVMACYRRALDDALSSDLASLRGICRSVALPEW